MNLGRFNVAIKGTLTFLVRGKVQGAPSMGVTWLVSVEVLAIVYDLTNNWGQLVTNSTKSTPLEKFLSINTRKTKDAFQRRV